MKATDDELVAAIKEIRGPYATAVEVAEIVDLTPEHTRKRLKRLVGGPLASKENGKVRGYWVR